MKLKTLANEIRKKKQKYPRRYYGGMYFLGHTHNSDGGDIGGDGGGGDSGGMEESKISAPYVIDVEDNNIDDTRMPDVLKFTDFIYDKLGIKNPVNITMTDDREKHGLKTLAHFNNDDSKCVVYSKNRNMADILRSIAHELVHKSQFERGQIGDKPVQDIGGPIEDEANAVAGQLVKEFGYKNPGIFE